MKLDFNFGLGAALLVLCEKFAEISPVQDCSYKRVFDSLRVVVFHPQRKIRAYQDTKIKNKNGIKKSENKKENPLSSWKD